MTSPTLPERSDRPPLSGPIFSEELRRRTRLNSQKDTAVPRAQEEQALEETRDDPAGHETRPHDPPGEEMALLIAQRIAQKEGSKGASLPPPHDPSETNNFFSLVHTADDLAGDLPSYALSDDGKKIAFVRNEDLSLWLASSQGTHARKVFTANQDSHLNWSGEEEVLHTSGIFDLKFSPGGQLLYFQTDLAATSLGLQVYDERTNRVGFVSSANGYVVINDCERTPSINGYIIAYRHDYSVMVAQATDLYFLLGPRGKQLGPIGPSHDNVARFLYQKCGQGKPVPAANEKVPPAMRRTLVCGDVAYRYLPLRFLDGSAWQIFYAVRKDKAAVPQTDLDIEDYESLAMGLEEAKASLEQCRAGE